MTQLWADGGADGGADVPRGRRRAGSPRRWSATRRSCFLGEDIAAAGGVFKTTEGLLETFGPDRVRDTPITEQAIMGMAMGAAMTGLRPVAEIMFSDFFAVAWDMVANQIAKTRYMTDGQVALPLVIRTANGGGLRFGAQHSQSLENWAMAVPGPQGRRAVHAGRHDGPPGGGHPRPRPGHRLRAQGPVRRQGRGPRRRARRPLGQAAVVRDGTDATVVALAAMVPRALAAAEALAADGIAVEVIDLRTLVPLDVTTVLASVDKTTRLFTVEENPRLCGWGAEVASIVAEEAIDASTARSSGSRRRTSRSPSDPIARGRTDAVGRSHRRDDPHRARGHAVRPSPSSGTGRMGSRWPARSRAAAPTRRSTTGPPERREALADELGAGRATPGRGGGGRRRRDHDARRRRRP